MRLSLKLVEYQLFGLLNRIQAGIGVDNNNKINKPSPNGVGGGTPFGAPATGAYICLLENLTEITLYRKCRAYYCLGGELVSNPLKKENCCSL